MKPRYMEWTKPAGPWRFNFQPRPFLGSKLLSHSTPHGPSAMQPRGLTVASAQRSPSQKPAKLKPQQQASHGKASRRSVCLSLQRNILAEPLAIWHLQLNEGARTRRKKPRQSLSPNSLSTPFQYLDVPSSSYGPSSKSAKLWMLPGRMPPVRVVTGHSSQMMRHRTHRQGHFRRWLATGPD